MEQGGGGGCDEDDYMRLNHSPKKNKHTDDEGKVIKGKCFLAHSLIISRLQTHSSAEVFFSSVYVFMQKCVCAYICCLIISTCVFYGAEGIHVNTRVCVCMCKLYVGEYFMC